MPSSSIPEPSFWLELGFQALVALLFAGFAVAVRYASGPSAARRCGAAALLLLAVGGALALTGKLAFGPLPPPLMLLVLVCLLATVGLAYSPIGTALASSLSFQWLIGFQAFRLPLEVMMHEAATQGVMPVQMSFAGYNFDIVTGVSAILVALLYAQGSLPKSAVWAWNVVGSALLLIVVTIAILSMPTPLRAFHDEPPNVWVTWWPFVWLPTFMVPCALFGHLLVFRKLLRDPLDEGRVSTRRSSTP